MTPIRAKDVLEFHISYTNALIKSGVSHDKAEELSWAETKVKFREDGTDADIDSIEPIA